MLTETRSLEIIRALAAAGLDYVFLDTEHSSYDLQMVNDLIRAGRTAGLSCYVRVPDPEYFLIARTLDAGAHGIMVPRVETEQQVKRVIAATKYPPKGSRGYGVRSVITEFENATVKE
jgi:2-keto-3-deoxy-L-rhamnonate aldolase RhmA